MSRVGVFASPEEAREFKQLLLQLRASGFALQGGQRRPPVADQQQEFVVANTTSETVPPFAVMQCISYQDGAIEIQKPADRYGQSGPYLINSGREIKANERGIGRNVGPITVHTDGSADTELQRLSAEADEWYAIRNPAGNLLYLGASELRDSGDCVFAIIDDYPQVIVCKTGASGIAAASGTGPRTMASAACSIFEDDGTGIMTDSTIDEDIYNIMSTAAGANAFILASRNDRGLWVVTAEDCPA
jgi:hypothetical protein